MNKYVRVFQIQKLSLYQGLGVHSQRHELSSSLGFFALPNFLCISLFFVLLLIISQILSLPLLFGLLSLFSSLQGHFNSCLTSLPFSAFFILLPFVTCLLKSLISQTTIFIVYFNCVFMFIGGF